MADFIFPPDFVHELPLPPDREPLPVDEQADPDPGLGHPIVTYGQRLIDLGSKDDFAAFYLQHQGDGRTILLEGCAKNLANVELFEDWAKQSPQSAVLQLFAGAAYSHRAWEARGGKLASKVGESQWALFHAWLKAAAGYLEKAIELDPKDAEAYHRLMRVVSGDREVSKLGLEELFQKVIKLRPEHLLAHMEILTMKCEKWGGSHAEMFAFAEKASQSAPDGSLLHTLVPMAILERMVYYSIEGDYDGANGYLRSEETRKRLAEIYKRTIDSPRLQQTPLTPVLYNWLAAGLIYSNSHDGRKRLLELIADRITERPWAYIQMPVVSLVNELRASYGLNPL